MNRRRFKVFFILQLHGHVLLLLVLVKDIVGNWTKVKSIMEFRNRCSRFNRSSGGEEKSIEYSRVGSN